MSIWTTRKLDRDREYIVMKHPLRGINNIINGVKFRDSYAVVEKDSKVYHYLKKIPVLKKTQEYPLTYLRNLHFICRTTDVKMIYGEDVYLKFLQAEKDYKKAKELAVKQAQEEAALAEEQRRIEELEKAKLIQEKIEALKNSAEITEMPMESQSETVITISELEKQKPEIKKCCYKTLQGTFCKFDALDYSPSGYCRLHLLEDPKLEHFGIKLPTMMTRDEKKKARKTVNKKLQQLKKRGDF